MKNRLILAKDLLKDEGIIVVTIDNYEFGPLTLLMDEMGIAACPSRITSVSVTPTMIG